MHLGLWGLVFNNWAAGSINWGVKGIMEMTGQFQNGGLKLGGIRCVSLLTRGKFADNTRKKFPTGKRGALNALVINPPLKLYVKYIYIDIFLYM